MTKILHPLAGITAFLIILGFWVSTLAVELFGPQSAIVAVKTTIPWLFVILIPALATVGATGFIRTKGRGGRVIDAKKRRMPFIAANGLLVLVPAALFLASRANAGLFDTGFYVIQGVELLAGAVNLTLLGLSMRDGFRLTGRFRRRRAVR
ncbi:hypothetical protein [Rhodophyticola porphyridii]|uniref:Uncharacterized protein n=1 Tax=Rhodophyticola porphyridii TaxID=1852017 RepID=A0A3L9Y9X4_9RHOB|nr:hypothetical protein [Rhodophyticola porphyridii]RMA44088.1 hypothetical protein D9R08_04065 [Rhodophyticola porphyridii]